MSLARGLSNFVVALRAMPSATERAALRDAWRIGRALPRWFDQQALPDLMQRLDAESAAMPPSLDPPTAIRLADAAAGLDYFSPLGICLRRSLVRYLLLRRAGVPVVVQFGAKKHTNTDGSRIAGHAWLTLAGEPYAEDPRDYAGFTSIYHHPSITAVSDADASQVTSSNGHIVLSNLKSEI